MIENQPVMLKSVGDAYDFNFPISGRVNPASAELNLSITNSNLLHEKRAQLVVFINDYIVGQVKLNPVNNETQAKFVIDKEYLRPGYNRISLKVAQHYTETQCEDWSAPELWTNINTAKSTLTLNFENRAVTEKLSELDTLINDRLDDYSLTILRADEAVSDDYLYWGALIAQGVQLRLKHVPMKLDEQLVAANDTGENSANNSGQFNLNPEQLKHDAVLLGTKAQIEQLIPAAVSQAITGAYLGIFQQAHDKQHFILVISGTNNQEVTKAVQTFALLTATFPDAQQTVIDQALIPGNLAVLPHRSIIPGHSYQFSQFGFANKTLDLENSVTQLDIRLPADLYGTEEAMVKVNLNLAYGAAMRKDSVINISLNGLFNQAIQLKEPGGANYRNYQISIPLRNFISGLNTLKFAMVLTPSEYGQCQYVQRNNLKVSIYEDSMITFPEVGRGATLPDLELLKRTSFPLIKDGSAGETAFKVLDNSSDSIAAAWHFIAKLAAYSETPVFDIHITQGEISPKQNLVLIGKLSPDNQSVLEGSPVTLGKLTQFPYRYKEQQTLKNESFLEWLERVVMDRHSPPLPVTVKAENVPITQSAGLGETFLLMSYPSPSAQGGVVLALLSEPGNSLDSGVNTLFSSQLWSQLKGNIFTWDKQEKFYWQQEGNTFLTGHDNVRLNMIMYFSKHPWQWLALIVSLLVLVAWLIHRLLTKHNKKTHQQVD